MALSKAVKRIIISLMFGILFTFGYLFAAAIFVYIFYSRDIRWVLWPLGLPDMIYFYCFGRFRSSNLAVSFMVILANVPLYGALAYGAMWLFGRFRKRKTLPEPSDEPPPPPVFSEENSQ